MESTGDVDRGQGRCSVAGLGMRLGDWVQETELMYILNVTFKQTSHRKCHVNLTIILRKDVLMVSYVYYYAILGKELIKLHPDLTLCESKGQSYMTQNIGNYMQKILLKEGL